MEKNSGENFIFLNSSTCIERQVGTLIIVKKIKFWTTNFKNIFVSVMNMLLIYLFASVKLEKGHKKDYLALVLKLRYTMIFYEIG